MSQYILAYGFLLFSRGVSLKLIEHMLLIHHTFLFWIIFSGQLDWNDSLREVSSIAIMVSRSFLFSILIIQSSFQFISEFILVCVSGIPCHLLWFLGSVSPVGMYLFSDSNGSWDTLQLPIDLCNPGLHMVKSRNSYNILVTNVDAFPLFKIRNSCAMRYLQRLPPLVEVRTTPYNMMWVGITSSKGSTKSLNYLERSRASDSNGKYSEYTTMSFWYLYSQTFIWSTATRSLIKKPGMPSDSFYPLWIL